VRVGVVWQTIHGNPHDAMFESMTATSHKNVNIQYFYYETNLERAS
jgi:hypothetical protein